MDTANAPLKEQAAALVAAMTLEEKASLLSGKNVWKLKGIERLGLEEIMVCDGPHGLRKQPGEGDHLGINGSIPATCFPAASATACSFDRGLLSEVGAGIARECRREEVSVLLGPGLNIKRSPLCGRNFEYFSEDPCLSGELAAAFTNGVQSENVGVSIKHFALNSQETRRMAIDSVCDERAMREIYLSAFERVVKQAKPWTVMSSYNRLNGEYACENTTLLDKILRNEWGFDGLVVSDWGGMDERAASVAAGNDLEMPGVTTENDRAVVEAVRSGKLDEAHVDACARRVVELILRARSRKPLEADPAANHALACRAALESAVLLKNDGLLPGGTDKTTAVIGAFAREPRYQGAGSSKINPIKLDTPYDALTAEGLSFDYAAGYPMESDAPDEALIEEACRIARGKDIVYIFAGLPARYESEGFDRQNISMPQAHTRLIERVSEANPNVAVALMGGGVMELPWEKRARAILMCHLCGEAGAGAIAKLILGRANPCGKLAESWPLSLQDNPSYANFPGSGQTVEYRESIYVGYRYYDAAGLPVRYPFGHGLSYTRFEYSDMRVEKTGENAFTAYVTVKNAGAVAGAEAVQLYVAPPESAVFKAKKELKGFEKAYLAPGESRTLSFPLTWRDFAFYDTEAASWRAEAGEYRLLAAASSMDIRCEAAVEVAAYPALTSPVNSLRARAPRYYSPEMGFADVPDAEFEALLGRPIPPREHIPGAPHTQNSTFEDIRDRAFGRFAYSIIMKIAAKTAGDDEEMQRMVMGSMAGSPLRIVFMSGIEGMTHKRLDGFIDMLNGKVWQGLGKLLGKQSV